jgi:hydroxypyruvate reductase
MSLQMKTSSEVLDTEKVLKRNDRELLINLWEEAIDSVKGRRSVQQYFQNQQAQADAFCADGCNVIAIGKAASDMMLGAIDVLGDKIESGLVLTKYAHTDSELNQYDNIDCHESAHPVPDQSSLDAGAILVEKILSLPSNRPLLVLISGGASSIVEVVVDSVDLDSLQKINQWGLSNGFDINEINYKRQKVSLIKGGGLCNYLSNQQVLCLYISDVPEDNLEVVGSGLLYQGESIEQLINPEAKSKIDTFLDNLGVKLDWFIENDGKHIQHYIIADNAKARSTIAEYAINLGHSIHVTKQSIDMDYQDVADLIFDHVINGQEGIYVWGGEPTVTLPESPGLGGRNQSLALLLAIKFNSIKGVTVLVAGTDGTDGPTEAAGAVINGETYKELMAQKISAEESLKKADAYHCLNACNSLFVPGPTGTNVMDLIVVYKRR